MVSASRILIIGERGQLAASLLDRAELFAQAGYELHAIGRPALDFDQPDTIARAFQHIMPAVVINAAAWTNVDGAEFEPDAAMRANRDGPALLAQLADHAGIPLIHISTDYVFDGTKAAPYVETDATHPIGIYGKSKLAGELAVLAGCAKAIILRTAWVYSPYGKNFALSILKAARVRDRLRVVADQHGCPTEAGDLANAVLEIATRLHGGWQDQYRGIFHATGSGATSWHGFAAALMQNAATQGAASVPVDPITTADWPTPTARPADSRLDCGKLACVYDIRLPNWQATLEQVFPKLVNAVV